MQAGVDVFDSGYVLHASREGHALVFPYDFVSSQDNGSPLFVSAGDDDMKINMLSIRYRSVQTSTNQSLKSAALAPNISAE